MVKVIVPPTAEPVELNDFKGWMNGVPISTDQESMVQSLLKAGREEAESYQNVAYCEQTLQIAPDDLSGAIVLPRPPFRELNTVVAYLADGTLQDATTLYEVNDAVWPAELNLKDGAVLPGPLRSVNPLVITYTAGYDTTPEKVKQAILLYAAWSWMHRGGNEPIPAAFYALLSKGRVVPV
jgi:uncharacterized phiE125 gp8 family phage protein